MKIDRNYPEGSAGWIESERERLRWNFDFALLSAKLLKFHGIGEDDLLFSVLLRLKYGSVLESSGETSVPYETIIARDVELRATCAEFLKAVERVVSIRQREESSKKRFNDILFSLDPNFPTNE